MATIQSLQRDYQTPDVDHVSLSTLWPLLCLDATMLFWTLGQLFIYLLFAANLHFTFKHTLLRISLNTRRFLLFLTLTFFVSRLGNLAFYSVYYVNGISGHV